MAPPTSEAVEFQVAAGKASKAWDTGVGELGEYAFYLSCTCPYNILFSGPKVSVKDPTNTGVFPAGVTEFTLTKSNLKMKITPLANGWCVYWRDR